MRNKLGMAALICIIGLSVLPTPTHAQSVPKLINYQGRLTGPTGQPLADGTTVDLTFAFYGVESGPTPLYLTVLQQNVVITGGVYSVLIGSGSITPGDETSLAAVFQKHTDVWLGIAVDLDAEMTPRARISSVPYSLSINLDQLDEYLNNGDFDGDGYWKMVYWGDDCNDHNASVYPGAPEICDDGIDNDCDYEIDGEDWDCCGDTDNDSFFAYESCGTEADCNDNYPLTYPGAVEVCDGVDNQCPGDTGYGQIDEYPCCSDVDNDGYFAQPGCGAVVDCDDADNAHWDDCGSCVDGDGDDRGLNCNLGPDCDDSNNNAWDKCATCHDEDGDLRFEDCNVYSGIQGPDCNDANSNVWTACGSCVDTDGDSWYAGCNQYLSINGPDCNDANNNTWSTCATCHDSDNDTYFELCNVYNGINGPDCNDANNNTWNTCATCHDSDNDTYFEICNVYNGINGPDCNDADSSHWNDCGTCSDTDGDNYGPNCNLGPDCNNTNAAVHPGALEICDGIDNQCPGNIGYGTVDEGCASPMALIPSGCFNMGDAFNEGQDSELPVHNVCITSSFYMDVHELTNAEYKVCVDASACTAPSDFSSNTRSPYYGNPTYNNFPVIYVNWNQATAYCTWAGKRLPTEAEWEYAARGGLSGKRYPWGDSISGTDANYSGSGDPWDNDTSPVGNYAANVYGLYDMSGNVWEWVNDWFLSTYYGSSPPNDPLGPALGTDRVVRSGGWYHSTYYLRVSFRGNGEPSSTDQHRGFRCAKD